MYEGILLLVSTTSSMQPWILICYNFVQLVQHCMSTIMTLMLWHLCFVKPVGFNSSHPSAAYMRLWIGSALNQCSNVVNYANPVYGVATFCHQVRWLRWGHPSLFHTAMSLLIWYKNVPRERYIIQTYMDGIYKHVFRICTIWEAQSF